MFKSGDKICYLKNKLEIIGHDKYYEKYRLKDLYNIKKFYIFDRYNEFSNNLIYLKDYPIGYAFNANDFILLKESRKLKLKNIYEN